MSALKHGQPWTTAELAHVREYCPLVGARAVAVVLGRSERAVRQFAYRHGIAVNEPPRPKGTQKPAPKISADADASDICKLHHCDLTVEQAALRLYLPAGILAIHYDVPISKIWEIRRAAKPRPKAETPVPVPARQTVPARPWKTTEVAYLRGHYAKDGAIAVAKKLGRTQAAVQRAARKYQLARNIRGLEDVRSHCDIDPTDCDACWMFRGAHNTQGWPVIHGKSGRRVVWKMSRGQAVPADHSVRMTCGEPNCLNPAHMRKITKRQVFKENRNKCNDFLRAERQKATAIRNGNVKLSAEIAHAIRSSQEGSGILAARFGVSRGWVNAIKRGVAWKGGSLAAGL